MFHVAVTRAKQRLFLTHAKRRRLSGRWEARMPSPFIGDIEAHLLSHQTRRHVGRNGPPSPVQRQLF